VLAQDEHDNQPIQSFTQFMTKSVDTSIYFENTDKDEVNDIIMSLENGKASDIPIILLKKQPL
jgi:hypothetical protein